MRIFLSILGMIASFVMLYFRERIGDAFGEADWMRKVGGVYNVVIILAIIIFFWSLAELTHTTDFLFSPIKSILPGSSNLQF